jgi:hypothetical protein
MFKVTAALAVSLFLTACGQEGDFSLQSTGAVAAPAALQARPLELPSAQQVAAQKPVAGSEPVFLQRAHRDEVGAVSDARALVAGPPAPAGVGVDVELESDWNSVGMTAVMAVPSCGWWVINSTTAVGGNGEATFFFPAKGEGRVDQFTDEQLIFFVDHDGDGVCDESQGDEVFSAPLNLANGPAGFQLTLAQLQPAPYMCSVFSYLP